MNKKIKSSEIEYINKIILESLKSGTDTSLNNLKSTFYFKGRKAVNIAKYIIENLTENNETILDPFSGGGSFLLSALEADRNIIGIELDNYTYFALNMVFENCNIIKLEKLFKVIESSCKDDILKLYKTKCCNEENYIKKVLFDPSSQEYFNPTPNRDIKDKRNVYLLNRCPICSKQTKQFDEYDHQKLLETEKLTTSKFPKNKFLENSRINITTSTGSDKYDKSFTKRNQYALLAIQTQISKLDDCLEKKMLQHVLVNTLPLAKIAMYSSCTDILYHVVQYNGQDMNVWYLFEEKFKKFKKFKVDYFKLLKRAESRLKLFKGDYKSVLSDMNKSFDLIYTDFPYTDQIPHLERNQLYRVWLENFLSSKEFSLSQEILDAEIVQTNAVLRTNKSSLQIYYRDLDEMFDILSKKIKINKYVIFTIKLGSSKYIRTYSEIINLARKNGFEFVTRIAIDSINPTLRKQSAYANTLQKKQIVVFKKLDPKNAYYYIKEINYESKIISIIYHEIEKNPELTLTKAVNLIVDIIKKDAKYIVSNYSELDKIRNIVLSNFIVNENGKLNINHNELYLNIEDNQTIFIKLYDLIPVCIKELLDDKNCFQIEDLYLKLSSILCESDHSVLSEILDYPKHTSEILNLIERYCEINNGMYVRRKLTNAIFKESKDISQFSGSEFEQLIKALLEKEGFINTVVRGGAGDRGVDIITTKLVDKDIKRFFIQCKRWVAKVGSEPIQRLFAERELNGIDYAICVTTSDFTKDGKEAAKQFNVEMWNGEKVLELLNKHFPKKYFNALLPS